MSPELIADRLRAELVSGSLLPGTVLSQSELAERFGVSRIPIRDALRILAGEGLVEIEPNRGARAISLTPNEVREIYDLRILLECDCLERSARNFMPTDLDEIDRVRRKSDLDAATPEWSNGDWGFHRAVYRHARRPRELAMIEELRRICQVHVGAYATLPVRKPIWLSDHRRLVDHLRSRDIDHAIALLRNHLETAAQHLLARMGERPEAGLERPRPVTGQAHGRRPLGKSKSPLTG